MLKNFGLLDGSISSIEASAIVTATNDVVCDSVELAQTGIPFHLISDDAAPRQALYAFYDGRKIGRAL